MLPITTKGGLLTLTSFLISKDTNDLNMTTVMIPSAIIEHVSRNDQDLARTSPYYRVHIICPECMIPFHYLVDKWSPGQGFVLPVRNYFGKNICFMTTSS